MKCIAPKSSFLADPCNADSGQTTSEVSQLDTSGQVLLTLLVSSLAFSQGKPNCLGLVVVFFFDWERTLSMESKADLMPEAFFFSHHIFDNNILTCPCFKIPVLWAPHIHATPLPWGRVSYQDVWARERVTDSILLFGSAARILGCAVRSLLTQRPGI